MIQSVTLLPVTRHPPPATRYASPATRHPSPVTHHPPPVEKCCRCNSPLPLYGFVLLSLLPSLAVCITYSLCFVKSRVDEIEIALKRDLEDPGPRPRLRSRRVFYSYFLHLLLRLVLGISFVVSQNLVFYPNHLPNGFPAKFACVSSTVKPTVILNSTD